jgi:hypothetical protein
MDTASVRNALSFEPAIPGTMAWTSSNSVLTYTPSGILPFYVHYTLRLDTTAHSLSGQTVDGDGNGTPGDSFVLHFTTRFIDAIPPSIVARSPDSSAVMLFPSSVVNLTFSEPLNAASVNTTNIAIGRVGGSALPRTFQYWERGGKGGVNVYPTNGLLPGAGYLMRVSGVQDKAGNPIPTSSPLIWQFSVASYTAAGSAIDPFDSSVIRWLQPKASASTVGVDTAAFAFVPSMTIPVLGGDGGSAAIRFTWDTTASEWLLREELPSGGGQAVHWRKENAILQAYLFGDAGMSEFRFAIHDSGGYAVSRWMPVNWVGWKLVQWDLEHDSVGSWLGSGKPEGDLTFDSFQFRYVSGVSARSGELFVDQLEIVNRTISGIPSQSPDAPLSFALEQNYPNPFNPATVIRYAIVGARGQGQGTSYVRLVVYDLLGREVVMLVNENKAPGNYEVTFDAAGLASGVYFYRLSSGNFVQTRKMLLLQ